MKYLSAHFSGPRNLLSAVNGKIQGKTGESKEYPKKLKRLTGFYIWCLTNIGTHNEHILCYLNPP
jgi:hypothetical protein